jgi:threonine dehydrogenase-like Zn-dependent dehydrogenase
VAAVAKFPVQTDFARDQGATVFAPEPPTALVEQVADWSGGPIRRPFEGTPWLHPGGVDVVFATVGAPKTLEVGLRVARPRGTIVITGVANPGRFEWTPWYFKEIRVVGSNAFGVEEVRGRRQHAIDHYLDLARGGEVDVRAMLTHAFPIDQWPQAFTTLADQATSGALKVAFDYRS